MMSFLAPAILAGLAAVSIPVAIHLLNKFRVKIVPWAAMRFLAESLRKNERRLKLEDLILLLIRCLLVALLVLAFARPALKSLVAGDRSGPVAAVVLLDNSASMGQSDGVQSRFDQAKTAIRDWLDQRDPNSLTALFLVSDRTEPLIPTPQPDFALFRKNLERATLSGRGSDLAQGIRQAYQVLNAAPGKNREIRVYTDSQTGAWSHLDDIGKLAQENPDILLKPVLIGKKGEENVGIAALRTGADVPAAGQPCRIQAEVANFGTQPVQNVRVSLTLAAAPVGEAVIPSIAPGATQTADFTVQFATPGPQSVTATIPADAFAADNQRALALDVVRTMDVLLAEGGEAGDAIDRDGYFLANALVPLPRELAERFYLAVKFTPVESLTATILAGSKAVFLCNPGTISPEAATALRDYVSGGGNLVIFPGSRTDPDQWKQNTVWSDLLPGTLGPVQEAANGKPLAWQSANLEHPVTALWNDSAQGSLGTIKVFRYFPLTLKPSAEAKPAVIVRLANEQPAVVEWQRGGGRVVLFNSTATTEWTNLPLHPAFVPLVQRLMGYVNGGNAARLVIPTGQTFVFNVPAEWAGRDFSVQTPGDSTPQSAGQIVTDANRTLIRYSGTEKTGIYRVFVGSDEAAVFAVQLDPAESDLRQADSSSLEALSQPQRSEAGERAPAARAVVTHEFWTALIWVAAALFLVEAVLAHRFSLSR